MPKVGIQRVHIISQISGPGAQRFIDSQKLWPVANRLYREIFDSIGAPLVDGYERIECTLEEFKAGYDRFLGVDVLLTLETGQVLTLQEKFLMTSFRTATVEYYQRPQAQEEGDWFKLKCQLYFVGYNYPSPDNQFSTYVLLDWPRVVLATAQDRITWRVRGNQRQNAMANFKYCEIEGIPEDCTIARHIRPRPKIDPKKFSRSLLRAKTA